jgi:CBS domain containing-hemolysin-like protein
MAAEDLPAPEIAEHEDVDTIGGLVTEMIGRQPRAGDEVTLGAFRVREESAKGFRIGSLLFTRRPPEPAAGA